MVFIWGCAIKEAQEEEITSIPVEETQITTGIGRCGQLSTICDEHAEKCDNCLFESINQQTACYIVGSSCYNLASICIMLDGKGEIIEQVDPIEEQIILFEEIYDCEGENE